MCYYNGLELGVTRSYLTFWLLLRTNWATSVLVGWSHVVTLGRHCCHDVNRDSPVSPSAGSAISSAGSPAGGADGSGQSYSGSGRQGVTISTNPMPNCCFDTVALTLYVCMGDKLPATT